MRCAMCATLIKYKKEKMARLAKKKKNSKETKESPIKESVWPQGPKNQRRRCREERRASPLHIML